jgi:ankyrin repeat protein
MGLQNKHMRAWLVVVSLSIAAVESGCANELVKAAQRGDMQSVQALVAQGSDVNGVDYGDGMDITNLTTALHEASARGDIPMMKFLLSRGASVRSRDRWQHLPLHYAVDSGNVEAVKLLLDHGADPN